MSIRPHKEVVVARSSTYIFIQATKKGVSCEQHDDGEEWEPKWQEQVEVLMLIIFAVL